MTGSVCSFFIFCFILLLHLYPRKGTEESKQSITSAISSLHLYPRKGTEESVMVEYVWAIRRLHLYPRKGTEESPT